MRHLINRVWPSGSGSVVALQVTSRSRAPFPALAALLAILLAAGCTHSPSPSAAPEGPRVLQVTGPSEFQAQVDGSPLTIYLLGVDVEQRDPSEPSCLRAQAQQKLKLLLPIGSTVKFDSTSTYDGALAAVRNNHDRLVNADLVAAGLAIPHDGTPGPRAQIAQIAAANFEAHRAKVGYYSDQIACTVPAQVAAIGACSRQVAGDGAARTAAPSTSSTAAPRTTVSTTSSFLQPSAEEVGLEQTLSAAEEIGLRLRIAERNRDNINSFAMQAMTASDVQAYGELLAKYVAACKARRSALEASRGAAYSSSSSAAEAPSLSEAARSARESTASDVAVSESSAKIGRTVGLGAIGRGVEPVRSRDLGQPPVARVGC